MQYTLYFAYGSNMNEQQFKQRCPSSYFLCRAKVSDYRFVITSRGYASVLKEKGSTVYGVLCAITELDEKELDRKEEVQENIYRREWLPAVTEFGYSLPSLVYVDVMEDVGVPEDGYLEKILDGARRHDLPVEAIAEIETWATKK
jgi:gamma-glutamylcyclotransferase